MIRLQAQHQTDEIHEAGEKGIVGEAQEDDQRKCAQTLKHPQALLAQYLYPRGILDVMPIM